MRVDMRQNDCVWSDKPQQTLQPHRFINVCTNISDCCLLYFFSLSRREVLILTFFRNPSLKNKDEAVGVLSVCLCCYTIHL